MSQINSSNIQKMSNSYKLVNLSNINLHIGNGAKNALKSESANLNFKFFYKVGTQYKQCSAGFETPQQFLNFIKPIQKQYYIYEYIFENCQCCPYFDYEYEIEAKPTQQDFTTNLEKIITNITKIFKDNFNIVLNPNQILILKSHGQKSPTKFKVSWHIIIKGYYFSSNNECAYLCEQLKELDENFDLSVYSKDRLMRTYGSAKNWDDQRVLVKHDELDSNINKLGEYLITLIKPDSIKLKCSKQTKTKIEKKKYVRKYVEKNIKPNEIGEQIEQIVKTEYHEDAYFTKSVIKFDDIEFYGFNYTNRNQKCFTGFKHDAIGFYCWLDVCGNVILKCFSQNCNGCRKVLGNINKTTGFDNSTQIESDYLNNSSKVIEILKSFEKLLLIKSQMGTGKSELICNYLDEFKPRRVLWISVRQTYATNIKERFSKYGFVNYLDDKDNFMFKNKIIVQLESLSQLEKNFKILPYDLIVLDEIESILYHFDSSTIAHKSSSTFDLLHMLCKSTKTKIIGLDADLNLRTLEYAKDICPNYKLIINTFKKSDIVLNMTDNKDWWISEIKKAVDAGLKCCIIGLSTKLLYQIDELLAQWGINHITHTRESDDKFKKELAKVNDFWTKYQAVLYSPTITVGVDFTNLYFDKIFSIIVSNTASPRTFKQMLGRTRNLKSQEILTYYQKISIRTDSILYNYNEMIGYFKYADVETKTNKKYILGEDSSLEVVIGFGLYDRIMMHNRVENLNKSNDNFMTQLYLLCEDSNYKIQFISKPTCIKKKIELNDEVYRSKIVGAVDIDEDECNNIINNVINNKAKEIEKLSLIKYKFKNFWDLKTVTNLDLELYFRCEHTLNRLLYLMKKDVKNADEYVDVNIIEKTTIVNNIITTLGFDLNDLKKQLLREEYYLNVKKLFDETNQFKKDYANIRILFGKDKHELKDTLKGSALAVILNGFLSEFGININSKHSSNESKKNNIKKTPIGKFKLEIEKKYVRFLK